MATSDDKEGADGKAPQSSDGLGLDEFSERLDAMRGEDEPERPGQ